MFRTLFARRAPSDRPRTTAYRPRLEALDDRCLLSGTFNTTDWANWSTSPNMKTLAGDFNGDGRDDVMKFDVTSSGYASGGLWVGISTGGGFDTSEWGRWSTGPNMKVLAGDFNGDGRDDVMKFDVGTRSGAGGLWVGLSNGGGFDTSEWGRWTTDPYMQVLAGDFNGDGRTDVMKFDVNSGSGYSAGGLWVGLSNGHGFDTSHWADWSTSRTMQVLAGDFNGDGRTDVMKFDAYGTTYSDAGLWVGLSNGRGFDTSQWDRWNTSTRMQVLAGDFNGDGRTDVMKFDVTSSGYRNGGLWVGLSNGTGFDTSRWAEWSTSPTMKVLAGDFNRDGRTDVMKFDAYGTTYSDAGLWVGLSAGPGRPHGFDTSQWARWNTSTRMQVLAGDFNGDHQTDVMKFDITSPGYSAGGLWVGRATNDPVALGSLTPAAWDYNRPGYVGTVPVTGGNGTYAGLTATGLPPGVTAAVEGNQVVLRGTPTRAGGYSITVAVRDGLGERVSRAVTLTVNLAVSGSNPPAATAGVAYSASFLSTAGGSGSYRYAVVGGRLPAGLTLGPTGVLSGTPTGAAGGYDFTVRSTDADQPARTGTRSFRVTVNPGAAASFRVSASAAGVFTNDRPTVTVRAQDAWGNDTTFNGSVTLTSSNTAVMRSATVSLSGGVGTATVPALHSGSATLSVSGPLPGGSVSFTVSPSLYRYTWRFYALDANNNVLAWRDYANVAANGGLATADANAALSIWGRTLGVNWYRLAGEARGYEAIN